MVQTLRGIFCNLMAPAAPVVELKMGLDWEEYVMSRWGEADTNQIVSLPLKAAGAESHRSDGADGDGRQQSGGNERRVLQEQTGLIVPPARSHRQ